MRGIGSDQQGDRVGPAKTHDKAEAYVPHDMLNELRCHFFEPKQAG